MPQSTPLLLTSIISSQSSTRRSSSREMGMTPALLTNASRFPYRSHATVSSARSLHEDLTMPQGADRRSPVVDGSFENGAQSRVLTGHPRGGDA